MAGYFQDQGFKLRRLVRMKGRVLRGSGWFSLGCLFALWWILFLGRDWKKTGWKIEHATHYIYKWANIREKHLWMKTSRRKWRFCSNEGVWLPINSRHWPKEKQIRERLSTISRKLSIVTGWCFFGQFTHELGTFTH
jgi:hypothetical protein